MQRVFLVGYMGSGKTTSGKQLARMLNVPFIDLDREIEANEGSSIPDIFKNGGEASFRGIEKKALHAVVAAYPAVVCATGGGTPCFYDNMQFMNRSGITVYLQMDVASIVYRLIHAHGERPLVAGKTHEELHAFVTRHLEERSEFYHEAKLHIHALGMNKIKLESLAERIRSISAGKST